MKIATYLTSIAGAAAISSLSVPAQAATAVFDFGANNALNTAATPDTYTLTVGGLNVTVKAFGNIYDAVSYANPIDVTWTNNNGLGANTGNGDPQLNNAAGGINFGGFFDGAGEGLLLDFGQVVTLTQLAFGNFDIGDDFDIAVGNPLASGTSLADSFGLQIGGTFTPLTSYTGQQFFIAARDDGILDGAEGFRLKGASVNFTAAPAAAAAVPEPATWAMMLVGFGFVGTAMRRRPRAAMRVNFA